MNPQTTIQLPWLLLAAASTDATRYSLLGAYIDPDNRAVVATDGRRCVIHPIPGDAPVKKGYITAAMVKLAKTHNKAGLFLDYQSGLLNDIPTDYDADKYGNYPNWRQIDPDFSATYRAYLNPALLAGIVASLGVTKDTGICLEFSDDGTAPFRVTYADSRAVLMPMRGTEDSGLLIDTKGTNTEALKKQLAAAKEKIAELCERSRNSSPDAGADAAIAALRTELFQQRARVKELQAIIATLPGNATPPTPAPAPAGKAPPKGPKEKTPVPDATGRPVLSRNAEREGIELRFNGKPDETTRATLKQHGFRWLPGQPGQPWAVKYSEEAWVFAHSLAEGTTPAPMPQTPGPEPANVTPMPAAPLGETRVRKITLPDF